MCLITSGSVAMLSPFSASKAAAMIKQTVEDVDGFARIGIHGDIWKRRADRR